MNITDYTQWIKDRRTAREDYVQEKVKKKPAKKSVNKLARELGIDKNKILEALDES